MKTLRVNGSQHGLTLIEIMIAMLLGIFLTAGILQIFISSKQAYRLQENLSRLQENGRFAMDFLTKDIRMAGYAGCSSSITPNSILDPTTITIPALSTGMIGVDGANVTTSSWNGVANTLACGSSPAECVADTDVLSILSASSCGGQLQDDAANTAQLQIKTPNDCGLGQNDIAIVASCTHVDIFSISNNPGDGSVAGNGKQNFAHGAGALNCVPKLGSKNCDNNSSDDRVYKKNSAEILKPRFFSYYIRTGAGGLPSLWRVDNTKAASPGSNPVELIEGIENMQILYGVDSDTTPDYIPNYYVTAAQVPALIGTVNGWLRVVSVRISLLAMTFDDGLTDTSQVYNYNSTPTTPTDRRIRRVFSSTIAVRNRLP